MSLALTQPPGGLTFQSETISAKTASGTVSVGAVVKIDLSDLVAATPLITVTVGTSTDPGFYGVCTKAMSPTSSGTIQLGGVADVSSNGAYAEGDVLACKATDGTVDTVATGDYAIGIAMEAATGAGQKHPVLLLGGPSVALTA